MRGNSFGNLLTITTFGESHGVALGAIVDGCPAGIPLDVEGIQRYLNRRRPGQSSISTSRGESDRAEILSGVFDGKTLGTPICVVVRNHDARSQDYDPAYFRAGHADRVWQEKYGHRDHRGGGRASGRETLCRVIGGAIAEQILPQSLTVVGFTRSVGQMTAQAVPTELTRDLVDLAPTRCPDPEISDEIEADLTRCKAAGESRGGVIEVWIDGCPIGLGEPVFWKLKSALASAVMSVGAVVGFELGEGFEDTSVPGTEFHASIDGKPGLSSTANGIQGGITNGERIRLRVAFKPPSTVGSMATSGRHDPCIVPRAVPVIEAMVSLVLADFFLLSKLDRHE